MDFPLIVVTGSSYGLRIFVVEIDAAASACQFERSADSDAAGSEHGYSCTVHRLALFPALTSFIRPRTDGVINIRDDSCISNPKSEIADWTVQSAISDFGFEMQESSNFLDLEGRFPHSLT